MILRLSRFTALVLRIRAASSDLHVFLHPGEPADGSSRHSSYRRNGDLARTGSFDRAA